MALLVLNSQQTVTDVYSHAVGASCGSLLKPSYERGLFGSKPDARFVDDELDHQAEYLGIDAETEAVSECEGQIDWQLWQFGFWVVGILFTIVLVIAGLRDEMYLRSMRKG